MLKIDTWYYVNKTITLKLTLVNVAPKIHFRIKSTFITEKLLTTKRLEYVNSYNIFLDIKWLVYGYMMQCPIITYALNKRCWIF